MMIGLLEAQETITGSWTWIKGSDQPNDTGFYGQMGKSSPANNPRSRSGALTWTDNKGITWMYGGASFCDIRCGPLTLNDFWTYDPSSNNWTWIAGPANPGQNNEIVYGLQEIPSPGNTPGSRSGCFTWLPGDGKFWLYDPDAAEIWNYNPSTSEWTWMNGKPSPPNGVKGVPAKPNTPGSRRSPCCWKDNAGNIWVMSGMLNSDDMWHYERTTNTWTWVKGEIAQVTEPVYGTYRNEAPGNTPGPRLEAFTWTDNHGDFWLMSGFLFSSAGTARDLWKFNFKTKNWVWIKGDKSDLGDPGAVYGTKGLEDESNNPGERGGGVTWVDPQNNLWLMGGTAYHATLDELWRFNTSTLKWAWVRGAEEPTSYGSMGVTSPENLPPRRSQASAWLDKNGYFWMMNGLFAPRVGPNIFYNDIWLFTSKDIILAQKPLFFNATRLASNARLTWECKGEAGIAGYTIQRQDDGAMVYKTIGYAASKESSGQAPVYTYTDLNLSSGPTLYRLQIVHTNGEITYSESRLVPGLDQQDKITIFPNPSAGQDITIQFTGGGARDISLIAINGVITKRWFNYYSTLLYLKDLRPGTYLLQVENHSNKLVKTKKIVVVK